MNSRTTKSGTKIRVRRKAGVCRRVRRNRAAGKPRRSILQEIERLVIS